MSSIPLLRQAQASDIPYIMAVLEEAKAFQRRTGRPQWGDGYPSRALIEADLDEREALVVEREGEVAGYAVVVVCDKGYDGMPIWGEETDRPWVSIHRFSVSDRFRGHGLGRWFLAQIIWRAREAHMSEVRIDTGLANLPMQTLAEHLGFTRLGDAIFTWGPRVAYQLTL